MYHRGIPILLLFRPRPDLPRCSLFRTRVLLLLLSRAFLDRHARIVIDIVIRISNLRDLIFSRNLFPF